jgi:hypothetical protein
MRRTGTLPPNRSWLPLTVAALVLAGCSDGPTPTGVDLSSPAKPEVAFTTIGTAPTLTHTVVKGGDDAQFDGHISGSLVSYVSMGTVLGSSSWIRYHDLVTGIDEVVPNGEFGFSPDVDGSRIVFSGFTPTSWGILLYVAGGTAATELAPTPGAQRFQPAIGGNTVAWLEFGVFGGVELAFDIVAYDLATGMTTRLTNDALVDKAVAVSPDGSVIVWTRCQTPSAPGVYGSNCDIWKAVNSAGGWTTSAITVSPGEEAEPDTDGQIVVYASTRSGETDIYWQLLAGGAEHQVELPGVQGSPSISEGVIAFHSADAVAVGFADVNVWAYDSETDVAFKLTTAPGIEAYSDVWVSPAGLVRVVYTATNDSPAYEDIYAVSFQRPVVADLYEFAGFFQPVDNNPAVNKAKAGSAIPVKFSLGGDRGLDIFALGYPLTRAGTCDLTGSDLIEETVTAGGSSLTYDPVTAQYTYVWKTNKAWAGTCRQLVVGLNDGTTHTAWFNFVK